MGRDVKEKEEREHLKEEALFNQFFEHNCAIKLLIDPHNGKIEDANSAAEIFYGYPKNIICSMNINDINHFGSKEAAPKSNNKAYKPKTRCILFHRIASGELCEVEVFSSNITYRGRDLLLSIVHDISKLKITDSIPRESEQIFEEVQKEKNHLIATPAAEFGKHLSDLGKFGVNGNGISGREQEVLELIGQGFGLSEVAEQFNVSPRTIETHLINLRKKLGVRNNRELTRTAIRFLHHGPSTLSPEETRQMLLKLRSHQIELETQNEELRRAQEELNTSQARYLDLYDVAPVGYCTISQQGRILDANLAAASLLGVPRGVLAKLHISRFISKEDQNLYYLHRKRLFQTGESQACELRMVKSDGTLFWAHLTAIAALDVDGVPVCRLVLNDITERKYQEDEYEQTARLILLINTPENFREHMSGMTAFLKDLSGCEAIGIRLHAGDDYPYYQTRGFPPVFVHEENHLCVYGPDGKILRDGTGNPVLECMCGNVLCGRFAHSKPFFTANGSFWSNNTSALLADITEADLQTHLRNRCNREGYKSVALIPLRAGHEVFGLLQFNDHRPNRFTPGLIAHFERLADNLAITLSQHQAEEALRETQAILKVALDNTPAGIAIVDAPSGSLRYINDVGLSICGGDRQKMIKEGGIDHLLARGVLMDFDGNPLRHDEIPLVRAILSGESGSREFIFRKDTNNDRIIVTNAAPIRDGTGKVVAGIAVFIDITEERAAAAKEIQETRNRQLQKAESLSCMAKAIAHHFNNQLQAVSGYLEMALDELANATGKPVEFLNGAMKATRRASEVSSLMLIYLGQTPGKLEPLDISEVCRRKLPLLMAVMPKNVKLISEYSSSAPPADAPPATIISANATQIQQVLTNLVTNAWEAGDKDECIIHVSVKTAIHSDIAEVNRFPVDLLTRDHDYVCLEVADNGSGISAKDIDNIFDPFFSTKFAGRGMGLAVVLGIVRAHHGAITVESQPGLGSTFRAYFPVKAETVSQFPGKMARVAKIKGNGTILLVEDEEMVREVTAIILKNMGFTVLTANDGVEAVEVFRQHMSEIRCVICDLTMPRMNGWDTLTALRRLAPGIPVILASGHSEAQVMIGEHPERPQAFLSKPYHNEQLCKAIIQVLADKNDH
ncbi:MAG: PAS domain S-box protein [Candidatus Ozemobacteraceae bacterium]